MQVTLFYRDGSNYKDTFTVEVDERLVVGIDEGDEITMEDLELTTMDIPIVQVHGYEKDIDHSIVKVVEIKESEPCNL